MVAINDEVGGLQEACWVVGRTFTRSRQSGTTTRLDLVRAHSLELGEADADQSSMKKPQDATGRPRAKSEEQARAEADALADDVFANLRGQQGGDFG